MKFLMAGAAAFVIALVAGCGGGSGGDSSPISGNGSGPGASPGAGANQPLVSLVPAAPTLGAVLAADSAVLRPLRDAGVWTYRGSVTRGTSGAARFYTTVTTQTSTAGDVANESLSNSAGEGPDSQRLRFVAGAVISESSIDFAGKGAPENLRRIELRSPVRQGDQYLTLEKRYADTNIDADQDGRPDALDVAIYTRVIGIERLELRNLPALSALRTDTVLRLRVILTSTGQPAAVSESTVQTWYAPGIGIVRQSSAFPSGSGAEVEVVDEVLESFDGGNEGFGALEALTPMVPASSPALAGSSAPSADAVRGTAVFANDALVAMSTFGATGSTGTTMLRLDNRGRVLSASVLPTVSTEGRFVGHAQGMLHLRQSQENFNPLLTLELTRFDRQGQLIGGVGGVLLNLQGNRNTVRIGGYAAVVEGSTLWVVWTRSYNTAIDQPRELIARPFGLDGSPLGPEIQIEATEATALHVAGVAGGALVSWGRFGDGYEARYAHVTLGGTSVSVQRLASGLPTGAVIESTLLLPVPFGPHGALVWSSPLATSGQTGVAGVQLEADYQPRRVGSALTAEQLPGLFSLDPLSRPAVTPDRQRLVFTQDRSGDSVLWPGGPSGQVGTVSWFTAGSGPLASSTAQRVRLATGGAMRQLVFADRVIVLDGDRALRTRLVWLNGGRGF